MELNQLRYFVTTAKEGSIVNAARKLYISQAALSRSIAKLEAELGINLFDRGSNRIYLNKQGDIFLKHAIQSLLVLEDGVKSIRQYADAETGTLTISFSANGLATALLGGYILQHPQIHVMQYIQSQEQMQSYLLEHAVDLCITRTVLNDAAIDWEPLLRDELLVFVHKDHPLAGRQFIEMRELQHERFLLNGYGIEASDWFYEVCRGAAFEPDILYAGSDDDILNTFLQQNAAVYPTPASMYCYKMNDESDFMETISVLRIKDMHASRLLGLAKLKNRMLTPLADAYVDYVHTYCKQLGMQIEREFGLKQLIR